VVAGDAEAAYEATRRGVAFEDEDIVAAGDDDDTPGVVGVEVRFFVVAEGDVVVGEVAEVSVGVVPAGSRRDGRERLIIRMCRPPSLSSARTREKSAMRDASSRLKSKCASVVRRDDGHLLGDVVVRLTFPRSEEGGSTTTSSRSPRDDGDADRRGPGLQHGRREVE